MKKYITLFLSFLKIGAFSFGGGYAMIPLIENEFVTKRQWVTRDEFLDMTAIAESTPGPIAVNSATYIGFKLGGFFGALLSTFAVCLPSFVIIYIISLFLDKFLSLTYVAYAFKGIQVCVVYLIISAGIRILKTIERTPFNIAAAAAVIILMTVFSVFSVRFSSIYYILICGTVSVILFYIKRFIKKREADK